MTDYLIDRETRQFILYAPCAHGGIIACTLVLHGSVWDLANKFHWDDEEITSVILSELEWDQQRRSFADYCNIYFSAILRCHFGWEKEVREEEEEQHE